MRNRNILNMSRDQSFRRYSMNIPHVEQERLQGWLTIANAIETGIKVQSYGKILSETFWGLREKSFESVLLMGSLLE